MKKFLATASAVVLSLAMVAFPAITATADEVESTETATTETVTTEAVPEVTVPEATVPEETVPEETVPEETVTEETVPEATVTEEAVPEETAPETTESFSALSSNSQSNKPEDNENDKCSDDYLKPDELDEPSGSYTLMDGTAVIGTLDWADKTVEYDFEDGWTVDLCVKSGSKSNEEGDKVTYFLGLTGEGEVSVLQEISHLQYRATFTPPEECPEITGARGLSVSTGDECPEECPEITGARGLSVSTGDECPEECPEITGARGLSVSTDEECPTDPLKVDVDGTATDQVCVPSNDELPGDLVDGSIQLTVSDLDGVTKIEYSKDGGATTEVDLAGDLLIENLDPGKYDFVVTVADGYEPVDDFSVTVKADNDPDCKKVTICHWNEGQGNQGSYLTIDVSVQSIVNPNGHDTHENDIIPAFDYSGGSYLGKNLHLEVEGCGQLPTEGPITPLPSFTPATCDANGSYTLNSPAAQEGLPTPSVFWYVNDVLTADGTYSVAAPASITVKAVANTGYTFDDFTTERTFPTYQFTAPSGCDLRTLALTGTGDMTPALALTAFLGLLGLAMVRSGARATGTRKET